MMNTNGNLIMKPITCTLSVNLIGKNRKYEVLEQFLSGSFKIEVFQVGAQVHHCCLHFGIHLRHIPGVPVDHTWLSSLRWADSVTVQDSAVCIP